MIDFVIFTICYGIIVWAIPRNYLFLAFNTIAKYIDCFEPALVN